jgi:hypothetical protein
MTLKNSCKTRTFIAVQEKGAVFTFSAHPLKMT